MAVTDIRQAIVDLRTIPRDVRKELRPKLKAAAEPVAAQVRYRAGWSTRIPGAVRVVVLYGRKPGVVIRVSAKKAPHARPFEGQGRPGRFRHPLFANRQKWFEQARRPFLFATAREGTPAVQQAVEQVVADAAKSRGFN